MLKVISSFAGGALAGLSLGSPAEWALHKEVLHASQKGRSQLDFIKYAAEGHNDNHHGAYKGPEHYYRDITNQHEVIHFSKGDVGLIAGVSAILGGAINRAYTLVSDQSLSQFDAGDGAFTAGVIAGAMGYYGCYEFTHHYMHVIGERRLSINRVLGDLLQGGKENRDGKLRLSKPLLDDLCNTVEENIDRVCSGKEAQASAAPLVQRLSDQIRYNRLSSHKPQLEADPQEASRIIYDTYDAMMDVEHDKRASLSAPQLILYALSREVQKNLRLSPTFQYLDNHHFLHHKYYANNLNVVFPLMDYLTGTKKESSKAHLESSKNLWLCPNSPDIQPFERKGKKSEYVLVTD